MDFPSFDQRLRSLFRDEGWRLRDSNIRSIKCLLAKKRFREPPGSYGVFWTRAIMVLTSYSLLRDASLHQFQGDAARSGFEHTRWMLPPRGVQGGTLVLLLVVADSVNPELLAWSSEPPTRRFAAMISHGCIDLSQPAIHVERVTPATGQVFHNRKLQIADGILLRALKP